MQVFISWSGKQSKHVALALRTWLPLLLDGKVTPFVSSEDIDKGDRGLNKIADQLKESAYGIIVVTPSNQNSAWINFEAGALGKSVNSSRVAPLLVGLTDSDVSGPIKQFQNSEASDSKAVLSLVTSLNKALKEPLGDRTLEVLFKEHWPELEKAIASAPADGSAEPKPKRGEADLLDEVLTTVRSLQRDVARMQRTIDRTGRSSSHGVEGDIASLIMTSLGLQSLGYGSDDAEFKAELPEGAGKVDGVLQAQLKALSRKSGITISVSRPDGSSLSIAPDGSEMRTSTLTSPDDI